jgi:hypothetical protein
MSDNEATAGYASILLRGHERGETTVGSHGRSDKIALSGVPSCSTWSILHWYHFGYGGSITTQITDFHVAKGPVP